MIKKSICIAIVTILLVLGNRTSAQQIEPELSSQAFASLITCGPGDDFYTTFGHTALRICDSNAILTLNRMRNGIITQDTVRGIDYIYNYGTFNFGDNFYFKFAQGRLDYCLSRSSGLNNFLFEYSAEGRYVYEQKLNLSHEDLQKLFNALEKNYLPENRYYKYDFFKDNCATRIRDQINNCITVPEGEHLPFVESTSDTNLTFRQLLYPHMDGKLEWWKLGIDIVLGSICDKHASNLDYDFCPFELSFQVDTTTYIKIGDSVTSIQRIRLAEPRQQILEENRSPLPFSISPLLVFWTICLIVIGLSIISWAKQAQGSTKWKLRGLDAPLFLMVGIVSIVVLFLWFFSDHYCTKGNLNILWASPLFLYFGTFTSRSHKWLVYLQLLMLLALMGGFWVLPQSFNSAIFPIALMLFVRLLSIANNQKNILNNNQQ